MFEPLFRFLVFSQFYEFWGEIYKSKDGQSEEEKQIEMKQMNEVAGQRYFRQQLALKLEEEENKE